MSIDKKELEKRLKELGKTASFLDTTVGYDVVPTAFSRFNNEILKVGGLPKGRIIEVSGAEGSGKSSFAASFAACTQEYDKEKFIGIADSEGTYTYDWLINMGVDPARCVFIMTNTQEEVFAQCIAWVKTGLFSLVIIDSLGNLAPQSLNSNDWYKQDKKSGSWESAYAVGEFSRLCTNFAKQIVMPLAKTDTILLVCNHIRAQIGGFSRPGMPPPTTTPGGHCFGHDTSMHLVMGKVTDLTNPVSGEFDGIKSRVRVKRSKVGPANISTDDSTHLDFYLTDGIRKIDVFNTLDSAIRKNIILKGGAWYSLVDKDSGEVLAKYQGLENLRNTYLNDADAFAGLKAKVENDKSSDSLSNDTGVTVVEDDFTADL
jgi:recombination protein RecA